LEEQASVGWAINPSLKEAAEMSAGVDVDEGLVRRSLAQSEPVEYGLLVQALRGSPVVVNGQVSNFFTLSAQIASPSAMEALCRQVQIRVREATPTSPLAKSTSPVPPGSESMALVRLRPATVNQKPETPMALLAPVDIPQIYHRLVTLDQSRWFNSLLTRYCLCLLAQSLNEVLEGIRATAVPGSGSQGKATTSQAKDRIWAQIFPNEARTNPDCVSDRRAFDRRIARGRQWLTLVHRFGWGLLTLIPPDFSDSCFEKSLQQKNVLSSFMDHLGRRKPELEGMSRQAEELLCALLGGPLPEDVPQKSGDLLIWLQHRVASVV
jgi:hypothetical protein